MPNKLSELPSPQPMKWNHSLELRNPWRLERKLCKIWLWDSWLGPLPHRQKIARTLRWGAIRLKALCCQIQPYGRLSVVPSWIKCTLEPHPKVPKGRNTIHASMAWAWFIMWHAAMTRQSLEQHWKKKAHSAIIEIVNSESDRLPFPTYKGIPRRAHVILSNPTWLTHLLRVALSNCGVECVGRAKTVQ